MICTEGSDVNYSLDESEHEEDYSNPKLDIDVAIAALYPSAGYMQDWWSF